MADRTLTVNGQPFTFNRDRFAGVRTMTSGHVYPSIITSTGTENAYYDYTAISNTSFRVNSALRNDGLDAYREVEIVSTNNVRVGKSLVQFDLTLNSGDLFGLDGTTSSFNVNARDGTDGAQSNVYPAAVGSNSIEVEVSDDGVGFNPRIFFSFRPESLFDITISNLKVTHNYEEITVDRTASVIDSDRVGESRPLLSKVVGGAAAAYSLRDLNDKQGNNKVVRVRRASDNNERDFLAKEVSNGTLQNWVNTQVTPPLDIQALSATGRDGDFLIAKAAYSLRSLGTRQATLAATGDTVARANGKFVAQVRRSSDDALKSFTADEVTDGTLLAFVNNDLNIKQTIINNSNSYDSTSGTGTLTSSSSLGFTASGASSLVVTKSGFPQDFSVLGGKIKITYNASGFTGSGRMLFREATTGNSSASLINISNGTGNTGTTTLSGETNLFIFDGISGSDVSLEITSLEIIGDGFVKTWYDQSVTDQGGGTATGNHAVQATPASQPKIVNAGALNTSGGLEFDGSDFFSLTTSFSFQNKAGCVFSLQDGQDSPNDFTLGNSSSNRGIGFRNILTRWFYTIGAIDIDNSSGTSGLTLFTALHDGTTNNPNVTAFVNSSLIVDASPDANQGEANVSTGINQIGARRNISFLEGTVKEIIIYDTDQTDNREAIEANIGEAYSLTGIPAYDNTVDGFVETWYDQSGHGHDATQLTASNQPKIVDGGVLVTDRDGKLALNGNGAKLNLPTNAPMLSTDGTYSLFAVVDFDDQRNGNDNFNNILRFESTTAGGAASVRKPLIYLNQSNGLAELTCPSFNSGSTYIPVAETLSVQLLTNIANPALSTGNNTVYADGALVGSTNSATSVNTNNLLSSSSKIFDNEETTVTHFLSEVIYYPSDQSANRPAIEANIKNQYEIS